MDYQTEFLDPRPIFTTEELNHLHSLAKDFPCRKFLGNRRNVEEFASSYAYVSAKIEGCRYSNLGAAILLKHGFTEKGRTLQDAIMLANLHRAFLKILSSPSLHVATVLSEAFLCETHARASNFVLREKACGHVRQCEVRIANSSYRPLSSAETLKAELQKLFSQALAIQDPFEAAVYVHCNLAYLQFFEDCNKRVARLMQSALLVANNLTPLFLQDNRIPDYWNAIVSYYETGDYSLYKKLFFEQYTQTLNWFTGRSPKQAKSPL